MRKSFLLASALIAVLAALAVATDREGVLAAHAKNAGPVSHSASQTGRDPGPDFNRDGFADLAVGVPYEDVSGAEDAGAVQVIYGSSDGLNGDRPIDDQFWTENGFELSTIVSERKDHFGYALAAGDFNGDGFDDLAIGVPNQDVVVSGRSVLNAGAVYVLRGSSSGLRTGGGLLTQHSRVIPGPAEPGDHFGSSLTAGNFGRGPWDDLAIGVPDEDIRTVENRGAVNVIYGFRTGLTAHRGQVLLDLLPHTGERFGFSLEAADFGRTREEELVVGTPFDRALAPDREGAGAVYVAYGAPTGLSVSAGNQLFDQDGRGIPGGMAEPDDHFGWALAAADFGRDKHADLAVGVPGDGPGATGSVVIIYSLSYGLRRYRAQRWSQGSAGIVGTRERNDQFGYALAAADFGKGARADLAIGVPLDRGLVGGVNLLFGSSKGLSAIGNGFVWQDGSSFQGDVEGDSESTDEFGRALTAANFGKGPVADLAIGVPGESKEGFFQRTKLAVGAVNVLYGDGYGLRWSDDQFWWQASDSLHDSAEVFDQFGSVLAH